MEAKILRAASFSTVWGPCKSKPSYLSGHKKCSTVRFQNCRDLRVGGLAIRASVSSPNWEDDGKRYGTEEIRDLLIRQEDSLIFCLVERAQFCHNEKTYQPNAFPVEGLGVSLMSYMLLKTEELHAKIGRYKNPEENAFFPHFLPQAISPVPFDCPKAHPAAFFVNMNNQVLKMYLMEILPRLVREGSDDGYYGSTACCDVLCLQALSKLIHYGKFFAEAKFQQNSNTYTNCIRAQDINGLMTLLTDTELENAMRKRGHAKGIDGDILCGLIMPLSKEVQIQYLLNRQDYDDNQFLHEAS